MDFYKTTRVKIQILVGFPPIYIFYILIYLLDKIFFLSKHNSFKYEFLCLAFLVFPLMK